MCVCVWRGAKKGGLWREEWQKQWLYKEVGGKRFWGKTKSEVTEWVYI